MAILVERDLIEDLNDLISLGYDAVQACEAAIQAADDPELIRALTELRAMHRDHARDLSTEVIRRGRIPPNGVDFARILSEGRRLIEKLAANDQRLIEAMEVNEQTAVERYDAVCARRELPDDLRTRLEEQRGEVKQCLRWLSGRLGG